MDKNIIEKCLKYALTKNQSILEDNLRALIPHQIRDHFVM